MPPRRRRERLTREERIAALEQELINMRLMLMEAFRLILLLLGEPPDGQIQNLMELHLMEAQRLEPPRRRQRRL